jgi:class 3 adenylate cyclase/tetratricopeptide (TPR) repeat protein
MTEIGTWLRTIQLGEHEELFVKNDIDLEIVTDLTESDLVTLGLSLGHRKRLLRAIRAMEPATKVAQPGTGSIDSPQEARDPADAVAERRYITVMFCDLVGSTSIGERVDAEELRTLLLSYQSACKTEIQRFGGQVARLLGDGVIAYFGYPRAHEDDAERAVRAGFGIIARISALSASGRETLRVRIGLATGSAVVEQMIEGAWTDETATGRTLNMAARIQTAAAPDTIAVDENTMRLVGRAFHCADLGKFELKGFEPLRLWRVDQPVELPTRFEVSHERRIMPLAGRRDELAALLARWRDASQGRGQAVLISAEPGVGKSRLLHELNMRLQGGRFVIGQCLSYGRDTPYLPVVDLLKRLFVVREQDARDTKRRAIAGAIDACGAPASCAPLLAHLLDATERDDEVNRLQGNVLQARILSALTDLVVALGRSGPCVLAIEDLHWIDHLSENFLTSLTERIDGLPILFIATHRPAYHAPWSGQPGVMQIVLSPLNREDSFTLLRSALGERANAPEIATLVTDKAQGNPLFIEELSQAVAHHGAGFDLPDTVQGVLMSRIDSLPRSCRNALQTAAVLGRDFRLRVLEALWASTERLTDVVAELQRLQLIYERIEMDERVLVFRHALIQDAAYESLLKSRRRDLHRNAAQAIEHLFPDGVAEMAPLLAYHYVRAEDSRNAVKYLVLLADRSLRVYALKEADASLRQALALATGLAEPERRRQRLGIAYRLSQTLYFLGNWRESMEVIDSEVGRDAPEAEAAVTAPRLFWLSHMLVRIGRYDDAERAAQKAIEQAATIGDAATMGKAHGLLCLRACIIGEMPSAAEAARRSIELLRQTSEAYWLGMSEFYEAMVHITTGAFDAAVACGGRATEIGRISQDPRPQAYGQFVSGWALANAGKSETAIEVATAAKRSAPDPTSHCYATGFLAYAYLESGDVAQALPALQAASDEVRRIGFQVWHSLFLAYLSEAQRKDGSVADALATAERSLEVARAYRYPLAEAWALRARGRALAALQQPDEAQVAVGSAIEIFTSLGALHEVARSNG